MDRLRSWLPAWIHRREEPDPGPENAQNDDKGPSNGIAQSSKVTPAVEQDNEFVHVSVSGTTVDIGPEPPQHFPRPKRAITTATKFVNVLAQAVEREILCRDLQETISQLVANIEDLEYSVADVQVQHDAAVDIEIAEVQQHAQNLSAELRSQQALLDDTQSKHIRAENMLRSASRERDRLLARIYAVAPKFVDDSIPSEHIGAFAVTPALSRFLVYNARHNDRLLRSQDEHDRFRRRFISAGKRVSSLKARLAGQSAARAKQSSAAEETAELQQELRLQTKDLHEAHKAFSIACKDLEVRRKVQQNKNSSLLYNILYPALSEQGFLHDALSPAGASSQNSVTWRTPQILSSGRDALAEETTDNNNLLSQLRQARKSLAWRRRQRNRFLKTYAKNLALYMTTYRHGTIDDFNKTIEIEMGAPIERTKANLQTIVERLESSYDSLRNQVAEAGIELPPLSPISLADHSSDGSNSTTNRGHRDEYPREERKIRKWCRGVVRQRSVGDGHRTVLQRALDSADMLQEAPPDSSEFETQGSGDSTGTIDRRRKAWLERYVKHQENLRAQAST